MGYYHHHLEDNDDADEDPGIYGLILAVTHCTDLKSNSQPFFLFWNMRQVIRL